MGLIDVQNKVISCNMLLKVFRGMRDTYNHFMQLSEKEKQENSLIEEENQRWTFLDKGSECVANVYFSNGDHKRYHDIFEFISEYKSQGGLMDSAQLTLSLFYMVTDFEGKRQFYNERISLSISQRDIDISADLGTEKKLQPLYSQVLGAFEGAKPRYDHIIKNRNLYIRLVHNTVLIFLFAIVAVFFLFIAIADAKMFTEAILGIGFAVLAMAGALLLAYGIVRLIGRLTRSEEQKKIDEQNMKNREKRDAAIQEQYEKFARQYGGYYFYRIFKTVYPYRILKYYDVIMPDRLRTEVKGLKVNIQWDLEPYVRQSEICIGKGVDKAYCRVGSSSCSAAHYSDYTDFW